MFGLSWASHQRRPATSDVQYAPGLRAASSWPETTEPLRVSSATHEDFATSSASVRWYTCPSNLKEYMDHVRLFCETVKWESAVLPFLELKFSFERNLQINFICSAYPQLGFDISLERLTNYQTIWQSLRAWHLTWPWIFPSKSWDWRKQQAISFQSQAIEREKRIDRLDRARQYNKAHLTQRFSDYDVG